MDEPILVVEDDLSINKMVCEALITGGYRPQSAFSGSEAVLMLGTKPWKCVILDLMLPGKSGEEVLAAIRQRENMPVIVLTARIEKERKLAMLAQGADDYITKPFDIDELLARVAAQLRRFIVYSDHEAEKTLRYLDIQMHLQTREVRVGDTRIHLTQREFDILALLLRHPQQVYSRHTIYECVWNEEFIDDEKTINVHVSNLRLKLSSLSPHKHIKTVWGIGFRLAE